MMQQKERAHHLQQLFLCALLVLVAYAYFTINPLHGASSITTASKKSAVVTSGQHSVLGSPSLSASQIDSILSQNGSPATGAGQTFYDQSLATGINDAWPLSFFWHESNDGQAGMARITHSIGNLRCIDGAACINAQGDTCQAGQSCYAAFPDWQTGIRAWYNLIKNLYINSWGLVTVEQIIPKYAPAADHNDESAYINSVVATVASYGGR